MLSSNIHSSTALQLIILLQVNLILSFNYHLHNGELRLGASFILFCILEFRECFYLFARSGQIRSLDELTVIMRSLGLSPTIAELATYLKSKVIKSHEKVIG